MIDIHSHILPGIDDGSPDLETSLEMARIAVADGIRAIYATPHGNSGELDEQVTRRNRLITEFRVALESENIHLEIRPGMELFISDSLITEAAVNPEIAFGGAEEHTDLLLVELPFDADLKICGELLFQAQLKNLRICLAHPERYDGFTGNLNLFKELIDKGMFLQFNASSLAVHRLFSFKRRGMLKLLEYAPEQIRIASDAHGTEYRPPRISPARDIVCRKLGVEVWNTVTSGLP